jgi:hypothetical protein
VTEGELEREVRRLLKELKLWGYHAHDSRRSQAGWVDWVIIGKRAIFRELKSSTGQLSRDQVRVRDLLIAAGQDWALWRPSDLDSGRIRLELAGLK